MYYYAQHAVNGIDCFKIDDEKKTIQNYLSENFNEVDCPQPFEYLTEKQVKDTLLNAPDESWNDIQKARYNALKEYADSDYNEAPKYPVCLIAYPDEDSEHTFEVWSPNEDGIIDWWESLMQKWAKAEDEFDELPYFFTATDAADEVEKAIDDYNEDKAEAIIKAVFDIGKEYQTKAIVASLKLRDELEHWDCGDELPDELFDGTIQELCNFAGTDCPRIEAGDLYTLEDWGRKSVEYIGSPEEYFKEFLEENKDLKLPIVNGEVDWDNLDAETQQWGAGAWRDYVQSKENELCYDCLKVIREAFEALNWTFGTTF